MRFTLLHRLAEQQVVTDTGETGKWITVPGVGPVFIGTADPTALDSLAPSDDLDRGLVIATKKRRDGSEYTSKTYGEEWRDNQRKYKFARVAALEEMRPEIEASLEAELAGPEKSRAAAVACAVLLMARTGMRTGSKEGGRATKKRADGSTYDVKTYAACNLERRHVTLDGDDVRISFVGKKGVKRLVKVKDKALADGIRKFMDGADSAPGDSTPLFQDDRGRAIDPGRMNRRVQRHNPHFVAYNFRTAMAMRTGSAVVDKVLSRKSKLSIPKSKAQAKKLARSYIKRVADAVSDQLGNTPNVAIKQYCSPELCEYMLSRLGFSPEQLADVRTAYREDAFRAAMDMGNKGAGFPILTALLGKEAVDSWESSWLDDNENQAMDDVDVLEDPEILEAKLYFDRVLEMAGLR